MKIHKDCKVELATTKDKSRTAIRECWLEVKDGKGTIVSTDGRILAHIPVEVAEQDVSGYVSAEVLKAARKVAGRGDIAEVALNGNATLLNGATMPREGESKDNQFPNWRAVVPENYTEPAITIGIDALRLWQLAQAMGTQGVRLIIAAHDKPFLVEPLFCGRHSDAARPACFDARGVIMPVVAESV